MFVRHTGKVCLRWQMVSQTQGSGFGKSPFWVGGLSWHDSKTPEI
jgi:hypothetical protein